MNSEKRYIKTHIARGTLEDLVAQWLTQASIINDNEDVVVKLLFKDALIPIELEISRELEVKIINYNGGEEEKT